MKQPSRPAHRAPSALRRVSGRARPFEPLEPRQLLSTYVVDNLSTDDESDGDFSAGDLTLREAVELANASPGDDTILFDAALDGSTIDLTLGELDVTDDLTIRAGTQAGDAVGITLHGQSTQRHFNLQLGASLELDGLSLVGGSSTGNGGSIYADGDLTLTGVTVSGSHSDGTGGAIYSAANRQLTITRSLFSGNGASGRGGAIDAQGPLDVTGSTFEGNIANDGGALTLNDDSTIVGSTFSGNEAERFGGGIHNFLGHLTLSNSTFTLNRADRQDLQGGTGGAIAVNGGSATLTSTLISGNYRDTGVTTFDDIREAIPGTVTGTHNLIGDAATAAGFVDGVDNNLVGADASIGSLGLFGGDVPTHRLLEGSDAINTGANPASLATDARGGRYARDDGAGVDIGAYERQVLSLEVAHLIDEDNGDASDGDLSLREAIALSNENPVADQITFADGLTGTLTLSGSALSIEDVVTITGPGAGSLSIDAAGLSRVLEIDYPVGTLGDPTFIQGLTLTGGSSASGNGGAVFTAERLTLFEVTVSDSTAQWGGGVYASAQLIVADTLFTGNAAAGSHGGGIAFDPLLPEGLAIARSTLAGNSANGVGGGLYTAGTSAFVQITDSEISGNDAGSRGGGAALYNGGASTITGTTIADNTTSGIAIGAGGLDLLVAGGVTITSSTVSGNSGASLGGGIMHGSGTLTLINTTVSGNTASARGGGLYLSADAAINNSTIAFNIADPDGTFGSEAGAGIYVSGGDATLVSTIVASNTARGSDADNVRGSNLNLDDSMHNLLGPAAGGLTGGLNSNIVTSDAGLAPLAADLGNVATHALLSGSAAINAGSNPTAAASDATGRDRSSGSGVDIGARESDLVPEVTVEVPVSAVGGGQTIELRAEPVDEDGSIGRVEWFYDANNNGVADAGEFVGSDTNPSSGWTLDYTVPTDVDGDVGLVILAIAYDDDGNASPTAAADPVAVNELPVFDLLQADAFEVQRGDSVILTLANVVDPDGTVREVRFYFDQNGDGVPQDSEFRNADTSASNGTYGRSVSVSSDAELGEQRFIAVVIDNTGAEAVTNPVTVMVTNKPPRLNVLRLSDDGFAQGDFVVLEALGVSDSDGPREVAAVEFYIDLDNDDEPDPDELIAIDDTPTNDFILVLSREQTSQFPVGRIGFLAVAVDAEGGRSTARGDNASISYALLARDETTVRSAAPSGDLHRIVTVNLAGETIVFEQTGSGWESRQLGQSIDAPPALDDAITWTDPKDGLVFAAYPSDDGLILLTQDDDGVWTVRNLTDEIAGSTGPVRSLTTFVSAAGTGSVVVIAGIAQDGGLVGYVQQRAELDLLGEPILPEQWAFGFVDISASLDEGGFDTPAYTELISYRTAWDSWHLAGLDASGDIISVWTSPSVFTSWRADNLSEINGSPALVGGLTPILTSWRGINLTGINEQGEVVVSWWVPTFGGDWQSANLTQAFGGPALSGTGLTGYYTSWNGMNYAGLDENNQIVIYWWVPAFGGEWVTSTITDVSDITNPRPSGQLSSLASTSGTLSITGASDNGDVVRASWQPGDDAWAIENLSEIAQRR